MPSLVGSEMCIRDRHATVGHAGLVAGSAETGGRIERQILRPAPVRRVQAPAPGSESAIDAMSYASMTYAFFKHPGPRRIAQL